MPPKLTTEDQMYLAVIFGGEDDRMCMHYLNLNALLFVQVSDA